MRNILSLLTLTILLSTPNDGRADFDCCQTECCNPFSAGAKVAAFFPLDSKVRDIYGTAMPAFTLEGNWQVQCWQFWLDTTYVFANGHSTGGDKSRTHLDLVPITLGAKYLFSFCDSTTLYAGLGASYSFLHTKDHSDYVHKSVSSSGFGGIVKTGIVYDYCDNVYLEGFLNYTYQRFTFSNSSSDPLVYRRDVNLSALQLGLGVGMQF